MKLGHETYAWWISYAEAWLEGPELAIAMAETTMKRLS